MQRQLAIIKETIQAMSQSVVVILIAGILVGALLAPGAFGAAVEYSESPDKIAVIDVGTVIAPQTAEPVQQALQEARQNDSIEAVVLRVNTPGGGLSATEALALEVERTAEQMPVVVSVDQMAASGGYYVSAPADEIYANPSAMIGSVGINFAYVDSTAPGSAIQSGPDKAGGFTEAEAIEMADMMVEGFYGIVMDHRGDTLQLSEAELAHAKVYPSQQAVHNGMIDGIGTTDTAIQRAAELAGTQSYETVHLDTTPALEQVPILVSENASAVDLDDPGHAAALLDPHPGVNTPVPMALYGELPGQEVIVTTAGPDSATAVNQSEASLEETND